MKSPPKELVYARGPEEPFPYSVTEKCFHASNKSALIQSGWKLLLSYPLSQSRDTLPEAVRRELYQIEKDRNEQHDLSQKTPDRVAAMSELLARWQETHRPRVSSEDFNVRIDEETLQNLKALGYVQ